jgi:hypothetical protein
MESRLASTLLAIELPMDGGGSSRLKPGILARPFYSCSNFRFVHHSGETHMLREADAANERREFL